MTRQMSSKCLIRINHDTWLLTRGGRDTGKVNDRLLDEGFTYRFLARMRADSPASNL